MSGGKISLPLLLLAAAAVCLAEEPHVFPGQEAWDNPDAVTVRGEGIPDGGVEIGGVAHRALGRQVGELVHGQWGAGDMLREGNTRFVIVAGSAHVIVY